MGKIYTSYFGNLLKLREKGIKPISIALLPPRWYAGDELRELAPDGTVFIGYKENIVLDFSGYNRSMIYTSPEDELVYLVSEMKRNLDYITIPAEGLKIQPVRILKDEQEPLPCQNTR